MRLPLVVSVPHAGLRVPDEVASRCLLTAREIVEDGDEGSREIYALAGEVEVFQTTDVARAVVDLNRAEDDRRKDGVVKTHTCWDVPVWSKPLSEPLVEDLLSRYHRPYHRRLTEAARSEAVLGLDCHTMAAVGPPVGPDPGQERPWVCLGDGDGMCPRPWVEAMVRCLEAAFDHEIALNEPFRGGYVVRAHGVEMPWLQVEMSRAPFLPDVEKRARFLRGIRAWCAWREGGA